MSEHWSAVARRAVEGVGAQEGECILVRDLAGHPALLEEIVLACEQLGATPLVEVLPPSLIERMLATVAPEHLRRWDRHRRAWVLQADRLIVLEAAWPDFAASPRAALDAWREARGRLGSIDEERGLPFLLVAAPTEARAQAAGLSLPQLEQRLLPALQLGAAQLGLRIHALLARAQGRRLTLHTGRDCVLELDRGPRPWLWDDGWIDAADRERGAVVSNLPAGSIYTTVLEDSTRGSVWLPQAGPARDVVLRFEQGRAVEVRAAEGAERLEDLFATHSGEPRRVGHLGIGLNPHLDQPLGWTLVDEHLAGSIFLSLGENRYMGGQNASSLNVDYAIPGATLLVDGVPLVLHGAVQDAPPAP